MKTSDWNPQEAGKQANIRDQEHAKELQQQQTESQKAREYALNRKQRTYSVVRPAMLPIKIAAQQLCAEFNNELKNQGSQDKAVVYEDLGGMGLRGIPSAFVVKRHSISVELIPNYQTWQITLKFSDGTSRTYEVDDEAIDRTRKTFYMDGTTRVTPKDIAVEACKFVCQ
jgi:hypothetical protein